MGISIGEHTLEIPLIQGGMGIGVSLDHLAGSVAACGAMGTISSALCGLNEPDFECDPLGVSLRALGRLVKSAKERAGGRGMIAVNVMTATRQYAQCVRAALEAGADAIVCGAGLPIDLPRIASQVPGHHAALAPIVSSARAAAVICRAWARHGRLPDFVVLEGPLAGGHLGFAHDEAEAAQAGKGEALASLLEGVLHALQPFCEKAGRDIPVFVAGGVNDGAQMAAHMKQGAAGAQFATRFIMTRECDGSDAYKQILCGAKAEDVCIVRSPVGMPGRALKSPLTERVKNEGRIQPKACIGCLTPCRPAESPYCISSALIRAVRGDWENGLFFCGARVGQKNSLTSVREEIQQIMNEWREAQ